MEFRQKILEVLLFMPGFLFSLSCHEAAHAYVAYKFGDSTAKSRGRVSLSPIPHIDILGTLILPIFGLLFGGFLFGWGKPVPVDYRNLKNIRHDGMWISLAGPATNFILAIIFALIIHMYVYFLPAMFGGIFSEYSLLKILDALKTVLVLNLALCFFNLIPIHPLDGGKIIFGLLPRQIAYRFDAFISRWGVIILLVLIFSGGFRYLLWPPIALFANLLLSGF